jgi:hypothetical protein
LGVTVGCVNNNTVGDLFKGFCHVKCPYAYV